ncbi:FadR/GntR family transcriptional regulator [Paenibacillus piri]|uniref:FadR family transcriptional regulator n=1 Tax=Paenibacillus piri TaxID=2547395 RepID=A0A4R5KQH7_9BACL|nr:FadR/GntR family transcriptional regulator [Paenibacillus piri]TDF97582.1 FadR family transcriptional regulator [Paenibacillus piri]
MLIRKAYEVAADAIRDRIQQGEWPVGSRLPSVEQLAVLMNVGRSTIREALMSLKAYGWVDVRHGGGTFVLKASEPELLWQPPQITDIGQLRAWLELRFMLEVESAGLAAQRRSELHLRELNAIIDEMISLQDEDLLEQSDIRFHTAVAGAAGNHLLVGTLQSLFQSMGPVMRDSRRLWLFAEQSEAARLSDEHRQIVEAIQAGDAGLAKDRMAAHLRKVEQVLHKLRQPQQNESP